jgi:hypothetical protein
MNFLQFREEIQAQFERMKQLDLYKVEISKDAMWDTYQNAFPEGSNPIYRERRVHDCQCCKHFISRVGNVVAYSGGVRMTIWDSVNEDPAFREVAKSMAELMHGADIREPFYHYEKGVGTEQNHGQDPEGEVETWDHFYIGLPANVIIRKDTIATTISKLRSSKDVFNEGFNRNFLNFTELLRIYSNLVLKLVKYVTHDSTCAPVSEQYVIDRNVFWSSVTAF